MKLVEELEKVKKSDPIAEVNEILLQQAELDENLLRNWGFDNAVRQIEVEKDVSRIFNKLDKNRLYTRRHIEDLCLKYGLYCRPVQQFKGTLGNTLLSDLRSFSEKMGNAKSKLYIVAPRSQFLPDPIQTDPLVFAECGNDLYYLVSQWGSDISRWRRFFFRILPLSLIGLLAGMVIATSFVIGGKGYAFLVFLIPLLFWYVNTFTGISRETFYGDL